MAIKTLDFHWPRLNWSKKSDSLSPRSAHMHRLLPLDRQHPLVGIAWNQFLLNFLRRSSTDLVIPALPRERRVPVFCNQANMCSRMKKIFNPKVYTLCALTVHVSFLNSVWEIFRLATQQSPLCAPSAFLFFLWRSVSASTKRYQVCCLAIFFSAVCWYSFNLIFLCRHKLLWSVLTGEVKYQNKSYNCHKGFSAWVALTPLYKGRRATRSALLLSNSRKKVSLVEENSKPRTENITVANNNTRHGGHTSARIIRDNTQITNVLERSDIKEWH